MDEQDTTQTSPAPGDDSDTEGQAFKWQIVDDPKAGKRLSAGWTPDDAESGRPARPNTPTKGQTSGSR